MDTVGTEGEDPASWVTQDPIWAVVNAEGGIAALEGEDGADQAEDGDGSGSNKKKIKQSKSYTTAKTLNDREQRMLKFKLEHLDRETRLMHHRVHLQQDMLKRDLRNINPYIQDDPDKGFFVPTGMTRQEAEKLRDNKRNNAPKSRRSLSLDEFDALRKLRSDAVRKAAYEIGENEEGGEKKRPTNRGVAVPPKIHAVSFSTLAKVVSNTLSTANDSKKKRTKKESRRKDSQGEIKESNDGAADKKESQPEES